MPIDIFPYLSAYLSVDGLYVPYNLYYWQLNRIYLHSPLSKKHLREGIYRTQKQFQQQYAIWPKILSNEIINYFYGQNFHKLVDLSYVYLFVVKIPQN